MGSDIMDKKKSGTNMNFILLDSIGKAIIKAIPIDDLHELFNNL